MSEISSWFLSEVSRWRSGAALVWTMVVTWPAVYTTMALTNISILHPFDWIVSSLVQMLSVWTWPYIMVITAALAVLSVQYARQLTVIPAIHSTRWEKLHSIVQVQSVYLVAWSAGLGGLVGWSFTRLLHGRYDTLTTPCTHNRADSCLNEHHIFLVLHGTFVGFCYKLCSILSGSNHLTFPIIQQSKFFQMKCRAFSTVLKSVIDALHQLKYFYLLYYVVLGSVIQTIFGKNLGLIVSPEASPINTVSGMLDLSLLWHCVLSGSLTLSLLTTSAQIFRLYHTEWYQFPVETSSQQLKHLCLHNALNCQINHTVQYLGYQDLYMLSKHLPARRHKVFSLTQLGGHPQNWSNLSQQCLGLLKSFVDEVKVYNCKAMADGSMKHLSGENALITGSSASNGLKQRNVSGETLVDSHTSPLQPKPSQPTLIQKLVSDMKKKKIVAFFIAEEPDACSRKLFAKAQLYIWAVDALSYLTCSSYNEDVYGVVQKSLPEIIETLLALQEQVEKHFRLVSNISKRPEAEQDQGAEASLRNALKHTLKAAIYRIITTFDTHVRSVPLPSEYMRRLNHFLEYKE